MADEPKLGIPDLKRTQYAKHGANFMKVFCVAQIVLGYWIPKAFGMDSPSPWELAQLSMFQYMFIVPVDASMLIKNFKAMK